MARAFSRDPMRRIEHLPAAFQRFESFGGALDFAAFENAGGTEQDVLEAIPAALCHRKTLDIGRLRALGYRRITPTVFFGAWYNPASGALLKRGHYTTRDGRDLVDPSYDVYERSDVAAGGGRIPDVGSGGNYAYAFCNTPYGLTAKAEVVQQAFNDITAFMMPAGHDAVIWDWSNPALSEVSDYFDAGMEWWGVFLFSIYVPELRRLTIIAGSTTD